MKKISKGLYFGSIYGGVLIGYLVLIISIFLLDSYDDFAVLLGFLLMFISGSAVIYGVIMSIILFYKIWEAIQDGDVRSTPGKAVGFMFIPFFNLYWMFQATWGWAIDFNKYIAEKKVETPKITEGIPLSFCILSCCSIIPIINLFLIIPLIVLWFIFLNKAIDGANAIIEKNS